MNTSKDFQQLKQFADLDEGKCIVSKYLQTAETMCPNIVSEIRGLADGSRQNFANIFLLQLASEILFCHAYTVNNRYEPIEKGCTDILINGKNGRLIGHNDDWSDEVASQVCIVHVTITNDDIYKQFVSYVYPGYLPGFCFGMNKSLVITLNSLQPCEANTGGVPLLILLRSLLSCHSIADCMTAMTCTPTGCAYGMNINIASIHSNEMCSIEIYTEKVIYPFLTIRFDHSTVANV